MRFPVLPMPCTILTALQTLYQKHLRLQTEDHRMLMDGLDATTSACEVGCESVSRFGGEYSRSFGQPLSET